MKRRYSLFLREIFEWSRTQRGCSRPSAGLGAPQQGSDSFTLDTISGTSGHLGRISPVAVTAARLDGGRGYMTHPAFVRVQWAMIAVAKHIPVSRTLSSPGRTPLCQDRRACPASREKTEDPCDASLSVILPQVTLHQTSRKRRGQSCTPHGSCPSREFFEMRS